MASSSSDYYDSDLESEGEDIWNRPSDKQYKEYCKAVYVIEHWTCVFSIDMNWNYRIQILVFQDVTESRKYTEQEPGTSALFLPRNRQPTSQLSVFPPPSNFLSFISSSVTNFGLHQCGSPFLSQSHYSPPVCFYSYFFCCI